MKKALSLFAILLSLAASAQNYKVSGDLRSAKNEGVAFASIVLSQLSDSSMVKATTSNTNGSFVLNGIANGDYFLSVTFVGYERYDSPKITVSGGDLKMESITLDNSGIDLDAVTIRSEKALIEVMADKTVFNVENAGGTAGLNGFELLRRSPGVIIDNNDNLIVEGKSGVQIWIDGKPSILSGEDLSQYLRSLQASDIQSIEIITSPSSKYDAEGNAGIVNIKLKKDKRYGTNGSVSLGAAHWDYLKLNGSISLNNRTRKTNVYMTYSRQDGTRRNAMNFRQEILNQVYREQSEATRNYGDNNLKIGTDFYVSPKSTIGVVATGSLSNGGSSNKSRTGITPLSSDATTAVLRAETNIDYEQENLYLNANYRFEDTLGHSLTADIDYGFHNNDLVSNQPNFYFDVDGGDLQASYIYQLRTPLAIDLISAKADYEQKLLGGTFGLGAKASRVETDNQFGFFQENESGELIYDVDQSNEFDYLEDVLAAYVNYAYRKDKWSTQVGLRIENTSSLGVLMSTQQTENDRVKRNYTNLFPSAGLTYQAHQDHSLALNYGKRINRPNYESLNPFQQRLNELGFRQGNPFLQPNYTDNLKLSHTYKYRYTTALSYSYVRDYYAQVTDTLPAPPGGYEGLIPSYIQERNVADEQVISLSISAPFDLADWWSVYITATGYRTEYISEDPKFNPLTQNTFNFYGQNSFKVKDDLKFEVSGWFNSASIWGGTFVTAAQGAMDLAMSNKYFDKKLTASLSLSDVFYTAPWTARGEFNNLPIDGDGNWESRLLRLNLSYSFGNQELKSNRVRKTAAEEEKKRIQ